MLDSMLLKEICADEVFLASVCSECFDWTTTLFFYERFECLEGINSF